MINLKSELRTVMSYNPVFVLQTSRSVSCVLTLRRNVTDIQRETCKYKVIHVTAFNICILDRLLAIAYWKPHGYRSRNATSYQVPLCFLISYFSDNGVCIVSCFARYVGAWFCSDCTDNQNHRYDGKTAHALLL